MWRNSHKYHNIRLTGSSMVKPSIKRKNLPFKIDGMLIKIESVEAVKKYNDRIAHIKDYSIVNKSAYKIYLVT